MYCQNCKKEWTLSRVQKMALMYSWASFQKICISFNIPILEVSLLSVLDKYSLCCNNPQIRVKESVEELSDNDTGIDRQE